MSNISEQVSLFFLNKKNPSTNIEMFVVYEYLRLRPAIKRLKDPFVRIFIDVLQIFTHNIIKLPMNQEYYILEEQIRNTLVIIEQIINYKINALMNKLKIIDNLTSSERKRKKNA